MKSLNLTIEFKIEETEEKLISHIDLDFVEMLKFIGAPGSITDS